MTTFDKFLSQCASDSINARPSRSSYETAAHAARCAVAGDILQAFATTCIDLEEATFTLVVRLDQDGLEVLAEYARCDETLDVTVDQIRDGDELHEQVRVSCPGEPVKTLVAVGPFRPMTAAEFAELGGGNQ